MHVALNAFGNSLISRSRGALVRDRVLSDAGPDHAIVLDFNEVHRASSSFVDELVGKLISLRESGELTAVSAINCSDTIAYHVEQTTQRRVATPA